MPRSHIRSERGAALIELALSSMLLIVIVFGLVDFARIFHMAQELTNAARAGAQYGIRQLEFDATDVRGVATGASPNIATYTAPVVQQTCACVTDAGAATSGSLSCTQACVAPNRLVVSVTVSTTKQFTMVSGVLPFGAIPITRTVTMRAQ